MPENVERKCKNCEFWNKFNREQPMGIGTCQRKAPVKNGINILPNDSWPKTHHFDWCGEFEPRQDRKE